MLPGLIAVAAAVGALVWAYNSLARMRNIVRNAWADIDVQLKRRADLVPNLVETARGYSGFEREVLENVAAARSAAGASRSPSERAEAEDKLGARIVQVLAVAEQYPELKSSVQFLRLQEELSGTENSIAYSRQYYNAAVRDYNTMLDQFPLGTIGAAFGFRRVEHFSVDEQSERAAPSARMEE